MDIVWSDTALNAFLNIIDYLYDKWTEREVGNFKKRVDAVLDSLKHTPLAGRPSSMTPYRKFTVDKHTALIYSVHNDAIVLVTFISNRSSHSF